MVKVDRPPIPFNGWPLMLFKTLEDLFEKLGQITDEGKKSATIDWIIGRMLIEKSSGPLESVDESQS